MIKYKINFVWLKGHNGNQYHDRADKLAKSIANNKNLQIDQEEL